jgi:G3E family GTPase
VTVIDAPKYPKLNAVLGEFYAEQIRNADVLILNKMDLAPASALEAVRREVAALNPKAEILFTERCELDVPKLLDGPSSAVVARYVATHGNGHGHAHSHEHGHEHDHADHRHAPAQSFVLDSGDGAARAAVQAFYRGLPENVWRSKGFMLIDGQPSLIQYTMGQLEITLAEARSIRNVVFIGPGMDRAMVEARFHALTGADAPSPAETRRAQGGR